MIRYTKQIQTETAKAESVLKDIEEFLRGEVADCRCVFKIKLCLYEALSNSFKYGNRWDERKNIIVDIVIRRKRRMVMLEVYDEGKGIKVEETVQMPDSRKKGGRGIKIISEVADELQVSKKRGYVRIKFLEVKLN